MKKNVRYWAVLAGLAGACGCSPEHAPKSGPVPVVTAQAIATNVPVIIAPPPVGHVMAFSSVTIRPQVGGILSQVRFKEGSEVKSNALLFTIDPRQTQAALARDRAQLINADIQFDREQKLFAQKLVSQDEFDTSKATRDTLAATVQADELNLSYCEIRAPFDGVTGSLQFHEGNVVKAPDDTLLVINQVHPIYAEFAVPEKFLPEIKKQMAGGALKVSAGFENLMGDPPQGELTFVDNAVDATTGTILLKAVFPNENNTLWPGQFVQLELTLSELTNAVIVPSQALQSGQNGQFVYVVKSNPTNAAVQMVEMRPVTTGITFQNEMVVQSGLQAGETVVTDGQLRLAPGVKVSVKNSDAANTNAP